MNQDQNKLLSLITYAQESAKLKLRSCYDVKKHFFCQFEHEFQDLPGIHFNVESEEGGKWLVIDRLHETKAPDLTDPDLIHWVEISNTPNKDPSLRQSINMGQLQGEKYDISYLEALFKGKSETVNLKDLKEKNKIKSKFRAYLVSLWKPWVVEEKKRRKTINIYSHLFAIKHQLEGNITDAQLELSWGIGIVSWNVAGVKVQHPLITQAVDININDQTMALEIGPRDIDDYLELDFIDLSDNPGAIDLLKFYKDFMNTRTQRVSPFDRESFEAVLQSGAKFLDSKGVYWPSETFVDDRKVPTSSEILKITDTWVLIARPRDKSLFIQDLERFKNKLEAGSVQNLPPAVEALFLEPANVSQDVKIPSFRGISNVRGYDSENDCKELYFPLPFNNDQARIVQFLDVYNGVVVQGPPGTGKTHTIANIISHYLALGKRILVTSMKEPALTVLREKLPSELQPFAVSLLTNENDGMKQFEDAIGKIGSELQNINQKELKQEIVNLDKQVDRLHNLLAKIDRYIGESAKRNLSLISIDGDTISSVDAAKELVNSHIEHEWLQDNLSLDSKPLFNTEDLLNLRNARQKVTNYLSYIEEDLSIMDELPSLTNLLRIHQSVSWIEEFEKSMKIGEIPLLSDSTSETIQKGYFLIEQIKNYIDLTKKIQKSELKWFEPAQILLKSNDQSFNQLADTFDIIGEDLKYLIENRSSFIERPLSIPFGAELDSDVLRAVQKKVNNKRAFGLIDLIVKKSSRKTVDAIRVLDHKPITIKDWQHVYSYLDYSIRCRDVLCRYNSVARELFVEDFETTEPTYILKAHENFLLYDSLRDQINLEKEIIDQSEKIMSSWNKNGETFLNLEGFTQLLNILQKHTRHFELFSARSQKEAVQCL